LDEKCNGCAHGGIGRRELLKTGLGLGIGMTLAPTLALAQADAAAMRPQEGDFLVKLGDNTRTPLTPADVELNAVQTMAWAMTPTDNIVRSGSRLNSIMLLKLDPETLAPETRARAAEGVIAYTVICTHTGCEVVDFLEAEHVLYCECHVSKFDPRDGARVVDGPAPRPLPALPLKVVEGKLVVAAPFTSRVGFESA
jgi:Rieske Fe-S protein